MPATFVSLVGASVTVTSPAATESGPLHAPPTTEIGAAPFTENWNVRPAMPWLPDVQISSVPATISAAFDARFH